MVTPAHAGTTPAPGRFQIWDRDGNTAPTARLDFTNAFQHFSPDIALTHRHHPFSSLRSLSSPRARA